MYVARILWPVKTLGPGNRLGIWFSGCEHRCDGCSNPELWEQPKRLKISMSGLMKIVMRIVEQHQADGFTLSGGDPFYQPDALRELLPSLNAISRDILIYTGYFYEDLARKYPDILSQTAVLIDGPYIQELNHQEVLRGSSNQKIVVIRPEYQKLYDDYCASGQSAIQNFATPTGIASVGIHRSDYPRKLEEHLRKKGLSKRHGSVS